MKRLLVLTCMTALAACDKGTDGGLLIQVTVAPSLKTTNCIALEIQKVGDGTLLASTVVPRPVGDAPVGFAVRQADLPAAVQVQAVGYSGVSCDAVATRKLASRGELKAVNFPSNRLDTIALALGPPDAQLDADRDGVVATAKGGTDCDDANPNAYPGATQKCDTPVDQNCDGLVFCADTACSTSSVCMRPPDRLAFLGAPPSGTFRFDCSSAITIQSQDGVGVAAVTKDVALTLTGALAGTDFFADAQCKVPLPNPTIKYATTQTVVYSKASSYGVQTLTAAAAGLKTATMMFTVTPKPVSGFTFSPAAVTTTAGDCTVLTLQTADENGQATPAITPLTATVAASPAFGTVFFDESDTTCSAPKSTFTFDNVDHVNLRVRSTRSTRGGPSISVTASSSTVTNPGTLALTVDPAPAAILGFVSQAPGLVANACSGPLVSVGVRDQFGNQTTVPTDTVVTLSAKVNGASTATLLFSADATCLTTAETLMATIPANAGASTPVSIKGTARGTFTMTATGPNGITAATQTATIAGGPPVSIGYISSPTTTKAGDCSASPIVIETQDATNTRSAVQDLPLTVNVSATGLTFYSDDKCTMALNASPETHIVIPVGSAEGSFYYKGKVPGGYDVLAAAPQYTSSSTITQRETIIRNDPYVLVWVGTLSQTAVSEVCTAASYTLELRDREGNPTVFGSNTTVSVAGGVTASGSAGCGGAQASFGAMASQTQVWASGALVSTYTLIATAGGFSTSGTQATLTTTPGPYYSLALTTATSANVTAGACTQVTFERRDHAGNQAPVGVATGVNFTAAPATGVTVYDSQANCLGGAPLGSNRLVVSSGATAAYWVKATAVGAFTYTAKFEDNAGITSSPVGSFNVGAAAANALVWVTPANGSGSLNAGDCFAATLERRDAFNNSAPDSAALVVGLAASGVPAQFFSNAGCTTSSSSATIAGSATQTTFWLKATGTGTLTVTPSSSLSTNPAATFSVSPGMATALVFTTTPSGSVTAGTCTQLTVERRDAYNSPVPYAGNFNISVPSGASAFATLANCNANTSSTTSVSSGGTASGTFFVRPTLVPSGNYTINDGGSLMNTTTVNVNAAATASVSWSSPPSSLTAGVCQTLTLDRKDAFGNPATGGGVTATVSATAATAFYTSTDCTGGSAATGSVTFGSAETSHSFSVINTVAGSVTLTAAFASSMPTLMLTVNAGAANKLKLGTAAGTVTAGACTSSTVQALDSYDNVFKPGGAGLTVTLSATTGTAQFYSNGSCSAAPVTTVTIPADGSAVTFSFRLYTAPTTAIQAAIGGPITVAQSWSVNPASAAALTWKTMPASPLTRFTGCSMGEVQLVDAYANVIASAPSNKTLNLNASTATAGLIFYATTDCSGSATTTISYPMAAASAAFGVQAIGSGSVNVNVSDSSATYTATPNANVTVNGSTGALVATPATTLIEYFDCEAVVIKRQVSGADWTKGVTPLSVSSSSTAITVHSDASCTAALGSPSIPDGSASLTVYIRGHSAPSTTVTITATDSNSGFAADAPTVTALPLVRRGTCTIPTLTSFVNCTISPVIPGASNNISHTFMVFQATADDSTTNGATVKCVLTDTSTINCNRFSATTVAPVSIAWQTVSMGRGTSGSYAGGLNVQHLNGVESSNSATASVSFGSVTLNRSFLLFSNANDGATIGTEDFVTARLQDATTLTFGSSATFMIRPISWSAQIVEYDGLTVERGTGSQAKNSATYSVGSASLPTTRTFALAMTRFDPGDNTSSATCKRAMRVTASSATQATLARSSGNGNTVCTNTGLKEVVYERIQMPNTNSVQSCTVQIGTNVNPVVSSGTCTVGSAPTPDRTVLLLGAQGFGGQSWGETFDTGGGNVGFATGTLSISGTTVTVNRATSSNIRSDFSPFVIEFPL